MRIGNTWSRLILIFGALLAIWLTGCSSGASPHSFTSSAAASSSDSTPATQPSSVVAPSTTSPSNPTWTPETDAVTGTSFELPGTITSNSQAAAGPAGQKYQIRTDTGAINNNLGCGVSVETSLSGELYLIKLDKIAQVFATQFKDGGAKDVSATKPTPITVDGHPGVDFRMTFTTTDGDATALWLFRVIDTGTSQVMLESFESADSATPAQLELLNAHLTNSLKLP